jgi:hypothetical protein
VISNAIASLFVAKLLNVHVSMTTFPVQVVRETKAVGEVAAVGGEQAWTPALSGETMGKRRANIWEMN